MTELCVIAPGSRVLLGSTDPFEAVVVAVELREGGRAVYLCRWWNGRASAEAWLTPAELAEAPVPALRIGFRAEVQAPAPRGKLPLCYTSAQSEDVR